jgi:menaquinone-dependent protoporphyrinogen oxidase
VKFIVNSLQFSEGKNLMTILIIAASKHGSTREIADTIGKELQQNGHQTELYDAKQAPALTGYEAVIIGSAIYMGSWLSEARDYVADNQAALANLPVWLFSSGPLGAENPQPTEPPIKIEELMTQTNARDHQIFVGKLDKSSLGMAEKLIAKAVKAPYGDFRDWSAIRAWAGEIAAALSPVEA